MTTHSASITFDVSSDANFRSWGSAISTALQVVGLVKTTDTGQINWTTITIPSHSGVGGNIDLGYEIYKFNDSLQSSTPIFVKIAYGVYQPGSFAAGSGLVPSLTVGVGTATNGAGTFVGASNTERLLGGPFVANEGAITMTANTTPSTCYFSGDGSYLCMGLGIDPATLTVTWTLTGTGTFQMDLGLPAFLVIDRTRDATGVITNHGMVLLTSAWLNEANLTVLATAPSPTCTMASFTGNGFGTTDTYWPFAIPLSGWNTGVVGTVNYLWPLPMSSPVPEPQCLAVLGCYNTDLSIGSQISVPVLGSTHTYVAFTGVGASGGRAYVDSSVTTGAVLMRYE